MVVPGLLGGVPEGGDITEGASQDSQLPMQKACLLPLTPPVSSGTGLLTRQDQHPSSLDKLLWLQLPLQTAGTHGDFLCRFLQGFPGRESVSGTVVPECLGESLCGTTPRPPHHQQDITPLRILRGICSHPSSQVSFSPPHRSAPHLSSQGSDLHFGNCVTLGK